MSSVLTVSQINTYVKSIIDGDYNLSNIYVSGEISNFTNHYRTGHFYFTLKDEKGAIKAVMFRSAAERVRFNVENGMKVIIRGSISVFERDGVYQLYCDDMQPDGEGALSLAFEQLKEKLFELGLFNEDHKKPIPVLPKRIGVITSPTGAAVHDIFTVLERRFPAATVVFEPVQVQGASAALQIARAIEKFNLRSAADVLIVGRGGGSIEDLWAFNEEIVAHAIYDSKIPVISAVGHETDYTIADFVSDKRAPTPSAAAEIAVPDYREVLYSLDGILDSLTGLLNGVVSSKRIQLAAFEKTLEAVSPKRRIELYESYLNNFQKRLVSSAKGFAQKYENEIYTICSKLEATSPLKTLQRGYSMVLDKNQKAVKSVDGIEAGEEITVVMNGGKLNCTVNSVEVEIRQ